MYSLQHREIGSHWAEVENYSRRNPLCSYLNKPEIVLSVVQKCRSVHEKVVFMKLLLKDADRDYAGN